MKSQIKIQVESLGGLVPADEPQAASTPSQPSTAHPSPRFFSSCVHPSTTSSSPSSVGTHIVQSQRGEGGRSGEGRTSEGARVLTEG